MDEYLNKQEVSDNIEKMVCKHCSFYNHGEWSRRCAICEVSVCFQCITLTTTHIFNPEDEIGMHVPGEDAEG